MTGCERILSRLQLGPASAAELYADTFTVVHSRVSELRRRGHDIVCERVPGERGPRSYLYRLVSDGAQQGTDTIAPLRTPAAGTPLPSPRGKTPGAARLRGVAAGSIGADDEESAPVAPGQLVLL